MKKNNILATYTRSKETMKKYIEAMGNRPDISTSNNSLIEAQKNLVGIIKEFKHWILIKNDFPYDAIADISHILLPKRNIPFDWRLLNSFEKEELQILREGYIKNTYDVIYENLPSGQTIPSIFHLHLLKMKKTDVKEFMNN